MWGAQEKNFVPPTCKLLQTPLFVNRSNNLSKCYGIAMGQIINTLLSYLWMNEWMNEWMMILLSCDQKLTNTNRSLWLWCVHYSITAVALSKAWSLTQVSPWLLMFHHFIKLGAKIFIDAQIIAQNWNSRWRPSAILDFQTLDLDLAIVSP